MIAKSRPDRKLLTLNPSTKLSTSRIINTPIITPTNHKVMRFKGSVMRRNNAPTVALTIASTTHTTIAVRNPSTVTPGTTYAAIAIAIQVTRNCNNVFMRLVYKYLNE